MTPELLLPWLAPLWALWLSRRPQASRPLWMRRSLLLLLVLRACWDPPRPDPNPWLALRLPARLRALSPAGQQIETEVEIAALSETGVQLAGADGLPPGSRPLSLLLNPGDSTALPALPLRGKRPSPGRLLWDRSDAAALRSLSLWLFTRPGAWPCCAAWSGRPGQPRRSG